MAQDYRVEKVSQEVSSFEAHGKEFKSYTLKLIGLEQPVQLNQLASTVPPRDGDTLYGDIDMSGAYGPKFKKAQREGGGGFRKPQGDSFAMFLSYAKDVAIAIMQNSDDGKWNQNQFDTVMDSVSQGAHVLWSNRPDGGKPVLPTSHPEADTVVEVKDDIKLSDIPF